MLQNHFCKITFGSKKIQRKNIKKSKDKKN